MAAGDSNVYEMDAMNDDVEYMTRKLNMISNEVETVMQMMMTDSMTCENDKQFVCVHVYHNKNKYCF